MKLKHASLKSITKKGRYHDGNGLYLVVTDTGAKSWVYRYTLRGNSREVGLGGFEDVSLKEAREIHHEMRHKVKVLKIDIKEEREAEHKANDATFRVVAEEYIKMREPSWKSPKSPKQWRSSLEAYVYPVIGDIPVERITVPLIREILLPIWTDINETADRVRGRIHKIINYAIAMELSNNSNPAVKDVITQVLPVTKKKVRHFKAMPFAELPAFYDFIRDKTAVSAYALKIAILTTARTGTVTAMRRDEVKDGVWTVPADKMKRPREQRYPLGPIVMEILDSIPVMGEYYFPALKSSGTPHISNGAMLTFLKKKCVMPYTPHGFRSTFRDWSDFAGFESRLAEIQLAHVNPDKTERAYARSDRLEERAKMMNAWCEYVDGN